ncbi:MAG TPA: methyltransferase domain-containing protein [Vicinamibacterales bacterium]|nr:methyltransferase domain-containing protein [Vicinamibacterales bacterium]
MPWLAGAAFVIALLPVMLSEGPLPRQGSRVDGTARTPDIHYTPTRHNVADAMLRLANVTSADMVYDLGSGDGRIPIIAAQKYGAFGVGIEIEPKLVALATGIAKEAEVANRVSFITGDLFEADLSKATVVTAYLSTTVMTRLMPKLRALRPGTRIVSHRFAMPGWPPDRTIQVEESELLLWVVK